MNISHIPFSFFLFVVARIAVLILGNLRKKEGKSAGKIYLSEWGISRKWKSEDFVGKRITFDYWRSGETWKTKNSFFSFLKKKKSYFSRKVVFGWGVWVMLFGCFWYMYEWKSVLVCLKCSKNCLKWPTKRAQKCVDLSKDFFEKILSKD